jgi:hypothetical protein
VFILIEIKKNEREKIALVSERVEIKWSALLINGIHRSSAKRLSMSADKLVI